MNKVRTLYVLLCVDFSPEHHWIHWIPADRWYRGML